MLFDPMPSENPLELMIRCVGEDSGFGFANLAELLWTVDGVQAVEEVFSGDPEEEQCCAIRAYVDSPAVTGAVDQLLKASAPACRIVFHRLIAQENWSESWKRHWHVNRITERLTICPSWEVADYSPENPGEIVIRLDPGSAFGTGTHATTRLMLQALEELAGKTDLSRLSVMDVGTGSGILAIAAAKLGCQNIMALDIEPASIKSARENAELNGVSPYITVTDTPLQELCLTRYDVILANILAPVVLDLLTDMCSRLTPMGILLVSGLVEKTVDGVQKGLLDAGFTDVRRYREDTPGSGQWFALGGRYG